MADKIMQWGRIKITSDASITDGVIDVLQTTSDPLQQFCDEVVRWKLDTCDAQVRAGLIALGWTPPSDA